MLPLGVLRTSAQPDQVLVRAPRAAEILDSPERSLHRLVERGDLEAGRLA